MILDLLVPLVQYSLFCVVSFFTGRGVLRCIFSSDQTDHLQLLYPIASLTCWSLILGVGVAFSLPLHVLVYPLWGITFLLAGLGVWKFRPTKLFEWAGITILALSLSLPYVMHGFSNFLGSPAPDGWGYVTYGQYLWKYARCTEGGLTPMYQFGAYLCHSRYIASSLLLFISVFLGQPGTAQIGMGYFLPWAFWLHAASLMFFIQERNLSKISKWIYLILGILSGWTFTVLFANNVDNALAISFFPVLVGAVQIADLTKRSWQFLFILLMSATIYIYPEMSLFLAIGMGIFIWGKFSKAGEPVHIAGRRYAFIGLGIFVLIAPYWLEFLAFLQQQSNIVAAQVQRAGGRLSVEIVSPHLMGISFWGFTAGETYLAANTFDSPILFFIATCTALILTFFFLTGSLSTFQEGHLPYIALQVVFFAFIAYFVFVQRFGYVAYKIILLDWWLISYLLSSGIERMIFLPHPIIRWMGRISAFAGILLFVLFFGFRVSAFEKTVQFKSTSNMRDLQNALEIVADHPLAVTVLNMTPNLWALYYTRDQTAFYEPYRSYPITLASEYTKRAATVAPEATLFLLTDFDDLSLRAQADLIWQNPVYFLWKWKNDRWIYVPVIENPNGLEAQEGKRFFWLGGEPTSFEWIASHAGLVELSLRIITGPSLPDIEERHLHITLPDGSEAFYTVSPGIFTFPMPVKPGKNMLMIEVLDEPSLLVLSNGDTRPLLLGVQSITVDWVK